MKSCSNQNLPTTSLSNCKNSLAAVGGEQCPCSNQFSLSAKLANDFSSSEDSDNLSASSLSPVSSEDQESVASSSNDDQNDLMLIDLTCFESTKPLCCKLVEKVF